MPVLIVTVVLIVTIAVLAYPYLTHRARRENMDDPAEDLAQRLRRARDRVYEEIRALQQDHLLGTMSEEEYQAALHEARTEAALLMQEQQGVQRTLADIDEAVEAELRLAAGLDDEPDEDARR